MTVFFPETIQLLGTSDGRKVILGMLACDSISDLPSQDYFTGFRLSMGFQAICINDGSRHMLNSLGNWIQTAAGSTTYTRAEIDTMFTAVNAELNSQKPQIDYLMNTGAKNILQNTAEPSRTLNGITWVRNEDDSMTSTGTSTGVSAVRVAGVQGSSTYASAVPIPRGEYIVSPSGFELTRFRFALGFFENENAARTVTNIYNEPQTLTVTSDTARYDLSCVVAVSGETLSGEIWLPMIRPAVITDDTYAPYAPTNRELYEMIRGYHP